MFRCDDDPIAVNDAELISRARFFAEVEDLAAQLPGGSAMLNLCEDRYHFSLALLAAIRRRQLCLLPPSRQPAVLGKIMATYAGSFAASDEDIPDLAADIFPIQRPTAKFGGHLPDWGGSCAAVAAFTSGSTGTHKACLHSVDTFAASARMALAALDLAQLRAVIVSTTRAQHMFGLETTVFWPLFSSLIQHPGRPFFPEDVRQTVINCKLPCILATTPTHLSALVRAEGNWSNVLAVICSTAFLPQELARNAEALLRAPVMELYGSTETLSIAWRRTALESVWLPYGGVELSEGAGGAVTLSAPHLPLPRVLEDRLQLRRDGRFLLLGRGSDMVKVGGKRGSLAEFNALLRQVEGVDDGVFHLYGDELGESRLAAIIVGELSRASLLAALRPHLDEVFLPRRIHRVGAIPRNETGKLLQADWRRLLDELGYGSN